MKSWQVDAENGSGQIMPKGLGTWEVLTSFPRGVFVDPYPTNKQKDINSQILTRCSCRWKRTWVGIDISANPRSGTEKLSSRICWGIGLYPWGRLQSRGRSMFCRFSSLILGLADPPRIPKLRRPEWWTLSQVTSPADKWEKIKFWQYFFRKSVFYVCDK